MAMNTDEIQPTPPQPSSPSHDTNDPLKTGRRRSTTMMISPNLVAALEYDERTRAMTEASSPSIGHIPNPNLLGPGVFRGGLPPPPRTRKNSSTGKTKPRSDGGSLPFQGEVSPANSPPQLPPLRHSPSLSRELLEKPSAWNPYINPAPKLNVSHPPSYTVSAPNSPLHSPEDVHFATTTMLRGHSHTFSAPSSAPMIGHLDATQPNVPRHRRYLSSLVKGKINIGIVKRSEGLRRGDGEVGSVVVIEKRNMSEGRLREIGDNRRESFIGLSNRVIPSSWRTDRTETRSPSSPYSGNASATVASNVTGSLDVVRRVVKDGEGDGRPVTDASTSQQPTTASQHSHDRERSVSSVGSTQSSSRYKADGPGSSQPAGPGKQNPGKRTSHGSRQDVGKSIGETSPTNTRRLDHSTPATSVGFSPSSESGQDHDINDTLSSLPSPPSPYISISSTRYPSSSALSHSIDIFSDNPPGRSSMSPDRESFIDLASPTFPSPHSQHYSFDTEHVSLISSHLTTSRHSLDSPPYVSTSKPDPLKHLSSSSSKPPLPTTPKPNFKARASAQFSSLQRSPPPIDGISKADSPKSRSHAHNPAEALPPTTNLLNAQERAERVRKTKKLTQLFGQNPGPHAFSQNAFEGSQLTTSPLLAPPNPLTSTLAAKRNLKHQRGAASMSVAEEPTANLGSPTRAVWPPPEGTLFLNIGGRRHSSPLSPQEFSNFKEDGLPSRNDASHSGHKPRISSDLADSASVQSAYHRDDWGGGGLARGSKEANPSSPMSFMDLSDEEVVNDGLPSIITVETPKPTKRGGIPFSPINHSLLESVASEDKAEEERRRKREKLAKLHRFLGSRVPLDLVLAQIDISPAQRTPVVVPASPIEMPLKNDPEYRKVFMRRRRSSSAAEFSASWSDEIDRLKEDLNEREKAINVRRAVKMEKMFGVAPPQTLYHTRPTTLLSSSGSGLSSVAQTPPSPGRIPTPPLSPIIFATRNPNKISNSKSKSKKRPGTADSSEPLIPNDESNSYNFGHVLSDVYLHYRHSLNSLNDIIDRDDKESLVDLHDYLHGNNSEPPMQAFTLDSPAFVPSPTTPTTSATARSERRRSLPTRTSMTSLCSEFSIAAPTPTENSFQTRRRRAAKLTQFFGVDYRELMVEIIDSIEKGLEEERGKGTLKPDEIQDLLQKLVKLKVKRNIFT